jgi:opacity protein-like surface antigen
MKMTLAVSLVSILLAAEAGASTYLQGYAGLSFPHDSDAAGPASSGEVEFDQGLAAGVKVGGWWESFPYVGLQVDLNATFNSLDALSSGGARAPVDSDMNVYSATLNGLLRLPGGFVRPYAGAGAGYYFADIDAGTVTAPLLGVPLAFPSDNDGAFGWNALAGVELVLLPRLTLVAEYKYSRADFDFKDIGLEVDYAASQAYAGLSYVF